MPADLADRIRARIDDRGPIPVSSFVDSALYDPHEGFYASGGHAGRGGDFLTAPEVGPLFGAVISNAVDTWWREAGEPSRFVVAEHGAGPGTLARTVTVAAGACLAAGALEWVMVEPSDRQRLSHPDGVHLRSVSSAAGLDRVDVVLANELLDNLPFDIVARREDGWVERRVGIERDRFVLVDGARAATPPGAEGLASGSELPSVAAAIDWLAGQRQQAPGARIVALDYAAAAGELADRGIGWLRAFRDHQRVDEWLVAPGSCDITVDLPIEALHPHVDRVESQAAFLRRHGIEQLVAEGRALWSERAGVGDLAALRARSRVSEAEALLDPAGMGGFTVFEAVPAVHRG